jgi:hypothetical protein
MDSIAQSPAHESQSNPGPPTATSPVVTSGPTVVATPQHTPYAAR